MLLPSYTIDVWVTGSDESGNPYDSGGNTVSDPLASWPLALTGPDVSLRAADTTWEWSNPTPNPDETVTLTIEARNSGSSGTVTFVLQRLVSGDDWATISSSTIEISSGKKAQVRLDATANGAVDDTLEHRILLLDSGVEKERISISPLLVKEQVERDGTALANQVADSQLSVIMYLIALVSMSFAVWTMVQMRRIRRGEELDESDQTAEVIENMDGKMVPEIQQVSAATPVQDIPQSQPVLGAVTPPLPPTGLPEGWTMEQWNHYGHQYLQNLK